MPHRLEFAYKALLCTSSARAIEMDISFLEWVSRWELRAVVLY
jgi:hypothetical protein